MCLLLDVRTALEELTQDVGTLNTLATDHDGELKILTDRLDRIDRAFEKLLTELPYGPTYAVEMARAELRG